MDMNHPVFNQWFMKLQKPIPPKPRKAKETVAEAKPAKKPLKMPKGQGKAKEKTEEGTAGKAMIEFAKKRHAGAEKITNNAKEKGGPALLTYNHFKVKLPYYKRVAEGHFDVDELRKEYAELMQRLTRYSEHIENIGQKSFQELVGKIEVVGELLIRHHQ